jgi:hypothetical protein
VPRESKDCIHPRFPGISEYGSPHIPSKLDVASSSLVSRSIGRDLEQRHLPRFGYWGTIDLMRHVGSALTTDKALIRAAGEHAVVSELSRRGALAALVAEGARGVDVLASKGSIRITIQVKTRRSGGGSFPVQNLSEEADFTVLVRLAEPNDYWIVPTRELMSMGRALHDEFTQRGGSPASPVMIRVSLVVERLAGYHDAWDALWEQGRGDR